MEIKSTKKRVCCRLLGNALRTHMYTESEKSSKTEFENNNFPLIEEGSIDDFSLKAILTIFK